MKTILKTEAMDLFLLPHDNFRYIVSLFEAPDFLALYSVSRLLRRYCEIHVQTLPAWIPATMISRFGGLVQLNTFHHPKITGRDLFGLQLRSLTIGSQTEIFDEHIMGMPLQELDLSFNHTITNEGICNLPLTKLNLKGNEQITNEGIKNMKLTSLNIASWKQRTNIGDAAIKGLPLASLNISGNNGITDVGLAGLSVTKLKLGSNRSITDEGIKQLWNLRKLDLAWNETITDDGIKNLPLTEITLVCEQTRISVECLAQLKENGTLQKIQFRGGLTTDPQKQQYENLGNGCSIR
eukprot:TRINITY_DN7634_c2_g1_i1.p1 TRINITY_DN7634_c2_g1~~TRINITY_DN7634_c2_g1_i1.p1  ORF type:complete len:295 (+),score=52.53 TRINITY_DN7634_c2_g1_i1:46-930(+)